MASRRQLLAALVVAIPTTLAVVLLVASAPPMGETDYGNASVTVLDENGTILGTVSVRVADSPREYYVGLSKTDHLGPNQGMLFVHDSDSEQTYVMRNMSFPLDIIFVDANRTIRTIYHAPVPQNTASDEFVRYSGRGKWVLEVPYNWTRTHGVEPGDRIEITGRNG